MQKQKVIDQILEGNFRFENGSLDFSCSKLELSIQRGQQYEGSFRIYGPEGVLTEGTVVSSDWRMECLTGEFAGSEEEISFRFHGETLEEGDVVKGCFEIISNQGEYYLPFVANVEHIVLNSSVGNIKNLFHFANLAKSNWKEAVILFYSPEFTRVFLGSDARYAEEYRALSAYRGREQNVEEFLMLINKKQKIEYLVEEAELSVQVNAFKPSYMVQEQELGIVRNGWGFTQLSVECEGDFLFTEKESLTDDDFLGNHCRLPVFIDGNYCRRGKNFGRIRLYNSYVELNVPVTVQVSGGRNANGVRGSNGRETDRKRYIALLMEYYLAFRLRKSSTSTWLKETGKLVERLVAMDENDISVRLFQAQLLITEERNNEAGWILDHVSELLDKRQRNDELLAYYLYLTTLLHGEPEYIARVAEEVEHIHRRNSANWRVAWLLLYLSEDLMRSDRDKWNFLEDMFAAGCVSPVLYVEAIFLVNMNPALLRKLGGFEQQVLSFGAKQGILKREVTEQILYLAGKVKNYSPVLFRTLERLYGKKKDAGLLREICTLLIKGGKTGSAYLRWYRAGVDAQLRITKLYEYYMMSLDPDRPQEIPKAVLLYFSYQNNLDYAHSACLYSYILKNRDRLGDIYETNRVRMEHFIAEQIRKERINRNLADLYFKLLQPDMVNEQTCGPLSRLLFAHLIQVEDGRLRKVYVYHQGNPQPREYALSEGRTWVALYGSRYTIVFEDAQKNRFLKNVDYTMEKLMIPGKFLRWLTPLVIDNPEFDFYLCDGENVCREDPGERVKRQLRIVGSDYVDERVKRELYLRILQYYYDTDNMRALDEYLKIIPPETLSAQERGSVVRFMVLRGNVNLAAQWLETYGPYFVDVKILVRLISNLMERRNMEEDKLLLASAIYVFQKGKYDSNILEYLILYYRGLTRNMRDIWRAARSFDTDCYKLGEKILLRMLYSGAYVGEKMEIFHLYVAQGPNAEVEEAFLAQCAYDSFVRERLMEREVFREIGCMYRRGESVQRICKLAYLKYFAENRDETDDSDAAVSEMFLREMVEEGIYLEFFRQFRTCLYVQRELADKTIIEYRSTPRCKACIHYSVLYENGESGGYRAEYMKEAYDGVFFKEFVLFSGEGLQYYITEEIDGEEQLTESGTSQKSEDVDYIEDSRYQLINDIVLSKSLQDFDTMDHLLEEYYRKDFLNGRLFGLR